MTPSPDQETRWVRLDAATIDAHRTVARWLPEAHALVAAWDAAPEGVWKTYIEVLGERDQARRDLATAIKSLRRIESMERHTGLLSPESVVARAALDTLNS